MTALTGLLEHVPGAATRLVIDTHPAQPTTTCTELKRARRAAWHRSRRRQIAYGRWAPTEHVDPSTARHHLQQLRALGLSVTGIAALSGQAESTLVCLLYPGGRSYRTWITPATHAAIMATWLDLDRLPDLQQLSSAGTVRRLQALATIGWPLSALAIRLGVSVQALHHTRNATRVTAGKARRVRALYHQLHLTPGASVRTARHAAAAGWLPPLAWDEDSIDLPWAGPSTPVPGPADIPEATWNTRWNRPDDNVIDQQVIERALAGDPVPLTRNEWVAAISVGAHRGWSDSHIADRLGVSNRTILRARADHDVASQWRHRA